MRSRIAAAAAIVVSVPALAGPLTPPAGPVAPTHKTLSQIEPRTPVQSLAGDALSVHRITQPGSYYLTGDITVPSGRTGIIANVNGVTIDLNGFSVIGQPGSSMGINAIGLGNTVRNGSVRDTDNSGVLLSDRWRVENVTVTNTGSDAISTGSDSLVTGCIATGARNNGHGIEAGSRSLVLGCTANGNISIGITVGFDSVIRACTAVSNDFGGIRINGSRGVVEGCTATGNGNFGIATVSLEHPADVRDCQAMNNQGWGIIAGTGSVISGCTASGNGAGGFSGQTAGGIRVGNAASVTACGVSGNTGYGIQLADHCTVAETAVGSTALFNSGAGAGIRANDAAVIRGCVSEGNAGDGFSLRFGGTVRESTARSNLGDGIEAAAGAHIVGNLVDTSGAGQAGVRITGGPGRIDSNHIIANPTGLLISAAGNTVMRNSFRSNTTAISAVAGNDVGPTGTAATAASPWANIVY